MITPLTSPSTNAATRSDEEPTSKSSIYTLEVTEPLYWKSAGFTDQLGISAKIIVKNGNNRIGEIVNAVDPLRKSNIEVEIVSPHFLDPEGERLRE